MSSLENSPFEVPAEAGHSMNSKVMLIIGFAWLGTVMMVLQGVLFIITGRDLLRFVYYPWESGTVWEWLMAPGLPILGTVLGVGLFFGLARRVTLTREEVRVLLAGYGFCRLPLVAAVLLFDVLFLVFGRPLGLEVGVAGHLLAYAVILLVNLLFIAQTVALNRLSKQERFTETALLKKIAALLLVTPPMGTVLALLTLSHVSKTPETDAS